GGQFAERIHARPHGDNLPQGAGAAQVPALEGRRETGEHEGRLAAAGQADDREEGGLFEAAEQLVDMLLAAEEEDGFVAAEGAEAGVDLLGNRGGGGHRRAHAPAAPRPWKASRKGWRSARLRSPVRVMVHWGRCPSWVTWRPEGSPGRTKYQASGRGRLRSAAPCNSASR